MSLSSSSRNLCNVFVPEQLVQWCIIHSWFDESQTTLLTRSLYETSQFRASTNKMVFWWIEQTHTKFVPDEPVIKHHLWWRVQNLGNPISTSGFLSWNATKNSWRLHRLTGFVCEHLSVCLHNPFSCEAVYCIHHPHRKHKQDQWFLGPLLYLSSVTVVQVSPFFASVLLQLN